MRGVHIGFGIRRAPAGALPHATTWVTLGSLAPARAHGRRA